MSALLPPAFADLECWVERITAPANAFARDALRGALPVAERQAFHAAFTPRLSQVLAHLDATPLGQHDAADQLLLRLALAYPHIAQAVEVQGPDEAKHARARARIPITRAPADC